MFSLAGKRENSPPLTVDVDGQVNSTVLSQQKRPSWQVSGAVNGSAYAICIAAQGEGRNLVPTDGRCYPG